MIKSQTINILLADDDEDDCSFFSDAVAELNLDATITTVNDGVLLLLHLNKNANLLPDVLFLDLNMPRKNGMECLAEIRGNDKFKGLPIVVISTSFNKSTVDLIYQRGAHFYICKPTNFVQLKRLIRYALHELVVQRNLSQPSKERFFISQLTTTPL